jgi:hypothetical protein
VEEGERRVRGGKREREVRREEKREKRRRGRGQGDDEYNQRQSATKRRHLIVG